MFCTTSKTNGSELMKMKKNRHSPLNLDSSFNKCHKDATISSKDSSIATCSPFKVCMIKILPKTCLHRRKFWICGICETGKQRRLPNKQQLIRMDMCDTMNICSLSGSKYFLIFIDDLTIMCWVCFLKYKCEVFCWKLKWDEKSRLLGLIMKQNIQMRSLSFMRILVFITN